MTPQRMDNTEQGILPIQDIRELVSRQTVHSKYVIPTGNYQPASLDLRLGETAYSLQCSFLPHSATVLQKLPQLTIARIDIRDGAVLEKNRPYLIPLLEEIQLPPDLHAKASPKSSTGRLDIFTRLITDHSQGFDQVRAGYRGPMYIEVFSRSFTIRVQTTLSLNQLRFIRGNDQCTLGELLDHHQQDPVAFPNIHQPTPDNTLGLSINLKRPDNRPVGYRAKRNSTLLDLSQQSHHRPQDFWEPIYASDENSLILEPEEFYLLSSQESVAIPPGYAAQMNAYQTSTGELRTHYAGFFDPGFGYGRDNAGRICPVLEVRAHDVPFMIEPEQTVCTLTFEKMAKEPEVIYGPQVGSSYQLQGRMLSKHFKANP